MNNTQTRSIYKVLVLAAILAVRALSVQAEVPAVISDSSKVFRARVQLLGSQASLTGKDRQASLGGMHSDYYEYNTGIQLSFPLIEDKLFFFGNEELSGARRPSEYNVGTEATAHILTAQDERAISAFLTNRYGQDFNAGTAGHFSGTQSKRSFYNGLNWLISGKHSLLLYNHLVKSTGEELERDGQGFRFSSMAYDLVSDKVKTGLEWIGYFGDKNEWNTYLGIAYAEEKNRKDPLSNPNMPQVQIAGRTPGTLIYLGTDREASIYKNKQKTKQIDARIRYQLDNHTLELGTENSFREVDFGYMSGWNGRIDYLSIDDFLQARPYRVRGSYHYGSNDRQGLLDHPAAQFKVNKLSAYLSDKVQVNERLELRPALWLAKTFLSDMPALSEKTLNIWADPNFGTTYHYTPVNRIENDFFHQIDILPRLDVRYDLTGNKKLFLNAGVGLFQGEIPLSWLAYIYRHTGDQYGDYSQRADEDPFSPDLDPLKPQTNGISEYVAGNGVIIGNPQSGKTELDLADNDLQMPKFLRANLGLEYAIEGWNLAVEASVQKTIIDFLWQQVNIKDNPYWYAYDTEHQQPIYKGSIDPRFSSVYLLSNTDKGYAYAIEGKVDKTFPMGVFVKAAYTFGEAKDLMAGSGSSMEANRQLTPALIPNTPELAYSNTDIRHRIAAETGYLHSWGKWGNTRISLSLNARSGSPYSYGIVNHNLQGSSQYVSLVYIPQAEEAIHYFKDESHATAAQQAEAFNSYIEGDDYLKERRGKFTERNAARTPWNVRVDLHLSHELITDSKRGQSLSLTADIINVGNLLHDTWGRQYLTSSTFNSTASLGLVPALPFQEMNEGPYPAFTFHEPGKPYYIDYFASRTRLQVGLMYRF